jgi:class 3 adenylate cyclase/tetratricopeptide (TPR) repeat protein
MEQINCPHCGRQNPHTHNYCSFCGRVLAESCPRCGFKLAGEVDFCGNCGLGLTPRSQFLWLGDQLPAGGRWTAALAPRPPAEFVAPAAEREPEKQAAAERPEPLAGQPTLEQYIPAELMSKLDAARARGKMDGERRIVTMLFCDVVGSTAASEQLDPEEWTEIMNEIYGTMIRPVYKYEGFVNKLMGDSILAFFGAPIAHEDDPARAVMAGLEITEGLAPYREKILEQWGVAVDVRVGINTGLVVVGAVGSDLRMEYTAMGDAINLAARMEQTAAPGTVQITHDTYRQVAPLFDVQDLGGIEIKGKEDPVLAYRVLAKKSTAGRKRGIDGLEAEMVGRAEELSRLQDVLANLERGIGRIVCLLGAAGLGKSRLVRELRGNQSQESTLGWIETASLSYELSHPYALFQQLVRQLYDIPSGEEADQFWQKIQRLAAETPGGDESRYTRVFAALFALPEPSGQPALEGELFKRELYAVMAQIWSARFAERPTVLFIDDLHWADSASVELLLHLLPAIETSPLVLLCAFRPDRGAPSYQVKQAADADYPHRYTEINLRLLTEDESDELVNRLLAIADLPDSLRRRIWERSGGNPFYVEEVVRTLIESGAVVAEERTEDGQQRRYWRAVSEQAEIDIPENLQGLLNSRIDRLEEETRHVLQLASVIGRSFYHSVLAEIGRQEDLSLNTVDQQVGRLVRLEMIQEAARVPDVEYRFRNPMTQEVAYQTILLKRRREYHRRVGAALEALFPDRLGELATRLAFHYSQGRQADKALAHYTLVGDQAFRLFALEEALQSYDRALEWVYAGDASSKQLIHLYQRRGRVLELMLRHDEALETYKALEALGETRDDDELRLAGLAAQGISYTVGKFDLENSRLYTDKALAMARELGDRFVEARALWSLLLSHSYFDVPQALEYGEQGLAIARELVAGPQSSLEHLDLLALILMDLVVPLVGAGEVGTAAQYASEAREIFEELGNLPMASTAAQRQGVAYKAEGRFEKALEVYDWSTEIDLSIGNDGGLVGSSLGLFDIYQVLGDLSAVNARMELFLPITAREERIPLPVTELQPAVTYFQLGLLDKVLDSAGDVWQFKESQTAIWPDNFLCYLARTHIRLGDLDAGRQALAAIDREVGLNNYMLPLTANLPQATAELALAAGDWQAGLTVVDDFVKKVRDHGLFSFLPEKLLLRAQILSAAGQPDLAYETLQEARVLALEQGARPVSWRICAQLAGMEEARGKETEAQSLTMDARSALDFLAARTGDEDIRALFLALPEVRSVLERTGG